MVDKTTEDQEKQATEQFVKPGQVEPGQRGQQTAEGQQDQVDRVQQARAEAELLKQDEENKAKEENKGKLDQLENIENHPDFLELQNKYLRAKADIDNSRRQSMKEIDKARKYSVAGFAKEILNVVDSLEQGLQLSIGDEPKVKSIHEGMELTYKMLLTTLEKFGIQQINPVGENFDPAFHEALSMQPTDELEPNKVLTVVQPGFKIHDRILRPARVIVSKVKADA